MQFQFSDLLQFSIVNKQIFHMLRKVQTRGGQRQNFYHQTNSSQVKIPGNSVIRPPTCHPYTSYKNTKSQSQMRVKYSPTYFLGKNIDKDNKFETILQSNYQAKKNFQISQQIDKLPSTLKHSINQLRVLLKNQIVQSVVDKQHSQVEDIIYSLTKNIVIIVQQQKQTTKQNKTYDHTIKQLQEQILRIQKDNCKDINFIREKKYLKNKYGENYQQQIFLENCRLGEMNARYLTRIAELEGRKQNVNTVEPQQKDVSNKYDTQLLRCHNRISYLEIKLSNTEKNESDLSIKIQELEKKHKQIRTINDSLLTQNYEMSSKMSQWRQRAYMQKQDGETHISRQQFLLYSLRKLRENNKSLLDKLLSQNTSTEKIEKKHLMQSPNFEYQIDFFKNIRTAYEKGNVEKMYSHDQVKKNQLGVEVEENVFDSDYRNYKNNDKFDVNQLKFYRPTFFAFLEESVNSDIVNCRTKDSFSVSRAFIQILRGLLNSKLNEFLYIDSPEKFSRFPQFVYAWFQKFYFSSEKKCVMMLEPYMQKPISQQMFYRDLMNIRLDQSWEIITFRQFLMEELSLEELYFYLLCQHLLYTRAGITKQVQYQGDFTILVDYSAAKSVLDLTLNDFQSWNVTFLTTKLREKIIIKNKKEMIESGFFLRCLVQYYRIQRSNRYRYISKLCSEFKDSKKGLRFSSFMSIINKFAELPMEYKLKMYRDCYCLSKGVITPQSIFIICNESLIFLKYLKMKSFYRLPKISNKPSIKFPNTLETSNQKKNFPEMISMHPSVPYLLTMVIEFKKVVEEQNSLINRAESLGVSQINNQILYMIKALDQRNTDMNSNILKCKHFIHYFGQMMEKIRKITYTNFYELLEEQWKKKNKSFCVEIEEEELGQIFAQQIKATFQTYRKINQLRIWKNKIYNFRVHNAARKIQRQAKKKFIEPYMQMYQYLRPQPQNSIDLNVENKSK